jgi:hypothetical protein
VTKTRDLLIELIPKMTEELILKVKQSELAKKANTLVEAEMKKSATIDLGEAVVDSLAQEPPVTAQNMASLVDQMVDKNSPTAPRPTKRWRSKKPSRQQEKTVREREHP